MQARIYKPAKSAMQSAHGNDKWLFECIRHDNALSKEPLMARTSSNDMSNQIKIYFDHLDQAISFAQENNYTYEIVEPKPLKIHKKSYTDNFIDKN